MEIDPNFSSLLRTLRVDEPWVPPKTWESIPSESGRVRSADSCGQSQDPIYESSLISEANLVQLVVNALLGIKSSIMEIDKLAAIFSSSPADRTFHRVPTLWCRSLSTNALGKILKCISHSGLVVCLLQKFVNFYQCANRDVQQSEDKGEGSTSLEDTNFLEDLLGSPPNRKVVNMNEIWMQPPYSLINQAFAVAVKKVLQGYFGALNTMQASVKLRRSAMTFEKSVHIPDGSCGYTKISQSGITLLEVFLHTNELRTQIESLGNICFPRFADLAVSREALTAETNIEFHNFPRGVDLLSYLYLQLRNADPIHHALLKHLFVGSCEPYCGFIKSWIFRASIDDPYREFFVHKSTKSNAASESVDKLFLTEIKEQIGISVPCFLKDVHRPLVRAGLQLQVLVKFLSLFNFDFVGRSANSHCNLANIEEILPCWVGMSTDSAFLSNSLTFCKQRIEALICQRQNIYQMMLEKLQVFFSKSDIRYERMNHMVIPFDNAQSLYSGRSPNIPIILLSGADYVFSATTDEPEATRICTTQNATDASYTSEESSYELDSLHNSENSFYSSEEETESEGFLTSGNHVMPPEYLLHSDSLPCYTIKIPFPNSNEIGMLCFSQASCYSMPKQHGPSVHHYKNEKTNSSVSFCCGDEKPVMTPVLSDENYNSDNFWPVGLLKTPFYHIINYRGPKQPCLAPQSIQMTDENSGTLENTKSVFDKVIVPFSSKLDTVGRFEFMNARIGPWCHDIFSSWNSNEYYDLSANPILTRFSWFSNMDISKDRSSNKRHRSHFPYFDFSSVVDPCNFSRNVLATPDNGLEVEASRIGNSNLATVGSNGILADSVQHSIKDQPDLKPTCSSNTSREAHHTPGHLPSSVSGGALWVGSLHYSNEIESCAEDKWHDSGAEFEMPPDVVIDKCIVQEILLQYKYVSNFAIKLLEEGFDLHEHLLALRRYHFMELADWADTFIISVCKQKWSVAEPEKKVAEMQGILELSLQRSSCETDQYKERLYVYMNGQSIVPVSNSSAGLNIFDFMLLGYKVDWPIKIIVTPAALNIYAEIFHYLIQVRLAAFSLVEVWYYIKAYQSSVLRGQDLKFHKIDLQILIKLRQQMNHFLSALQQYLHSQLSNVSWSRFQHSLKHQVKDMLDLESVHMSYLAEALHICFLSEDTKPVAVIIENILQCALDFGLHLTGGHLYAGTNRPGPLNLQSDINLCKVSTIQTIFERNLKDLYLLYLKSPKHVDFSLCRFWDHLNYNEYYSNIFNRDTNYLCL